MTNIFQGVINIMSEYTPIETVKHSSVVREGDDSKLNAIRIEEGKFKGLV